MMMKTNVFFAIIACVLLLSTAWANGGNSDTKNSSYAFTIAHKPASSGITILRPELYPSLSDSTDPNEFKNLFVASGAGTSGIRLNPRAVSYVQNFMEHNTADLMAIKNQGRPYLNLMDKIFAQNGLPVELKYLAVIESELKSSAVSYVGAVGPWQFMASTARNYGLKVSRTKDERRDYYKSTQAAAKYLKYLFSEFGDWLLVIAAYNGGPGVVYNAIKKSKSRNFWDLQNYLPAESRNHVKRFIGAHYVYEGQGGITTLTKAEASEQIGDATNYTLSRSLTAEELNNAKTTNISGKYQSLIIAKNILMDIGSFNRYNPDFDKVMALPDNSYELKLPADKMDLFIANKYQILNESVNLLLAGGTAALKPDNAEALANK
jgi:membrane-bound lytic murein transglycosylase D